LAVDRLDLDLLTAAATRAELDPRQQRAGQSTIAADVVKKSSSTVSSAQRQSNLGLAIAKFYTIAIASNSSRTRRVTCACTSVNRVT